MALGSQHGGFFSISRYFPAGAFLVVLMARGRSWATSQALCSCLCCSVITALCIYYQLYALETKQRNIDLWGTLTRCLWKTRRVPRGLSHVSINATQSLWPQPSLSSTAAATCPRRSRSTNHSQCYPPADIPTPTPQRNTDLISYAQLSLEIGFPPAKWGV